MLQSRIIYLDPRSIDAPPPPFRTGAAGTAWIDPEGDLRTAERVLLSANSTHAMLGHGVLDLLNALPIEGRIGSGRDALLPPASLDPALTLLYEADRRTYGASYEFAVTNDEGRTEVEYRIRIDNREYQRSLSRLQFLVSTASREGRLVWIRI